MTAEKVWILTPWKLLQLPSAHVAGTDSELVGAYAALAALCLSVFLAFLSQDRARWQEELDRLPNLRQAMEEQQAVVNVIRYPLCPLYSRILRPQACSMAGVGSCASRIASAQRGRPLRHKWPTLC